MLSRDLGEVGERMFCPKHIVLQNKFSYVTLFSTFAKGLTKKRKTSFILLFLLDSLIDIFFAGFTACPLLHIEFACKVSLVFV